MALRKMEDPMRNGEGSVFPIQKTGIMAPDVCVLAKDEDHTDTYLLFL